MKGNDNVALSNRYLFYLFYDYGGVIIKDITMGLNDNSGY
ncbi:hypothetical protein TERTU_0032 [Teredinibacter turnerae T7901]|uniref:Uncharacterized protein n=1 Tax=Teredinibacter turnerae (strain ATCC 39867 / T7901) TaxID=377629 RepID=C5BKP5_TERTT|nr:hypothetical protein TERTU_0032 [Teredinibacter turnerae T7901]